jgi:hypothetical protein
MVRSPESWQFDEASESRVFMDYRGNWRSLGAGDRLKRALPSDPVIQVDLALGDKT